jgi:predicted dehydrogenase
MGIRGRGKGLARGFAGNPGAQVTHLCDVDERLYGPLVKEVASDQGAEPGTVRDVRRVLDDPSVDALVIATPDHWHALATIWACQAGKHVYVEKPASHNVAEGRRMVEAARKYKRVVQLGTQSRSAPGYHDMIACLRSGGIGKVHMARAWNSQLRADIGRKADGPVPDGVDYDLWLGPAPGRPFNPNRFHTTWHWNWDYGTGDMGNDGIHDLDIARWGLHVALPVEITCAAANHAHPHWETPDTVQATFRFPETNQLLVFEQRDWAPYVQEGYENGVAFYGTEGYILAGRAGWRLFEARNQEVPVASEPFSDEPHRRNWLEAIRGGKPLNADIAEGHASACLAHLANVAYRVGRCLRFDPAAATILGDTEAQALTRRSYRPGYAVPELT